MINDGIKAIKVNLSNILQRKYYSDKLQNFEKEFKYPLGNNFFNIEHGKSGNYFTYCDYFTFFEKLGVPDVLVLEKGNEIIGVFCAVLREINNQKVWYLCDFKIKKEYRGKKLYRKLMWKYFLPSYMKCQQAFAINMSGTENNKLFLHMGKIFKIFNINIKPNYLYAFTGKDLVNFTNEFWNKHDIVTNNGEKDIVVENVSQKLYHVVEKQHFENNMGKFLKVDKNIINDEDSVMYLSDEKRTYSFAQESVISLFNKGKEFVRVCSAEI